MVDNDRQLHLSLFIGVGDEGGFGNWRRPSSRAEELTSLTLYRELAQRAEAAKFDSVFKADGLSVHTETLETDPQGVESVVLLSALSAVTNRIGLIGTISSSFNHPYNVARQLAVLDHLSQGRAGWNVVTSAWGEENFGVGTLPDQYARYERAAEFLEVAQALWDSWEDDAVLMDRHTGRWADSSKIHPINHVGKRFSVAGPLNVSRPPQGHPVIVQAGASSVGISFAATRAEVIFTAAPTLSGAQAFYADIYQRAHAAGRDPERQVRIMPGLKPYVGTTTAEARELYNELARNVDLQQGLVKLQRWMGDVDLSGLDWDETIPPERLQHIDIGSLVRRQSRPALLHELALQERYSLRQLVHVIKDSNGHRSIVGTAEYVADQIATWFAGRGADGFNIMPARAPEGVFRFIDEVVPILQDRGLFRTEYDSETLRGHLGLGRPDSRNPTSSLAGALVHPSVQITIR